MKHAGISLWFAGACYVHLHWIYVRAKHGRLVPQHGAKKTRRPNPGRFVQGLSADGSGEGNGFRRKF
jgi:hypothetical protein